MLVESMSQLIPDFLDVIFELELFQDEGVPFILHELHERRDRDLGERFLLLDGCWLDFDKIREWERLACDGACAVEFDMLFDRLLLEDLTADLRYNGSFNLVSRKSTSCPSLH
jgi:hypothetical protein